MITAATTRRAALVCALVSCALSRAAVEPLLAQGQTAAFLYGVGYGLCGGVVGWAVVVELGRLFEGDRSRR